jgi:hypothetical protein
MLEVYSADWGGDTKRALEFLNSVNVNYDYVDVQQDKSTAKWVIFQNQEKERKSKLLEGSQLLSVRSEGVLKGVLVSEDKASE